MPDQSDPNLITEDDPFFERLQRFAFAISLPAYVLLTVAGIAAYKDFVGVLLDIAAVTNVPTLIYALTPFVMLAGLTYLLAIAVLSRHGLRQLAHRSQDFARNEDDVTRFHEARKRKEKLSGWKTDV